MKTHRVTATAANACGFLPVSLLKRAPASLARYVCELSLISFVAPPPSLQLRMLAYRLGLEDEATFLDHLVVELESIQNWVVAI